MGNRKVVVILLGIDTRKLDIFSLEAVSHPYMLDTKNRLRFNIKDPRHMFFLKKAERNKSYYMGVWHTHPQQIPIPSSIDWVDWTDSLKEEKTGCEYIFFCNCGYKGMACLGRGFTKWYNYRNF